MQLIVQSDFVEASVTTAPDLQGREHLVVVIKCTWRIPQAGQRRKPVIPEPLVNADIYCPFDFSSLALEGDDLARLVLVPNPAHNVAGDFVLEQGRVRADGGEKLTFSGISLLHPDLFAACTHGAFPLAPLLRAAMSTERVSGILYTGTWSDVGTVERLARLESQLRQG